MKPNVSDQGDEFFSTGLEKYLDATSAVAMFEKQVQQRVKAVVTKHQAALAKLFGDDWDLKNYRGKGNGSPPTEMYLGQKVTFNGCQLYFYLWFGRDEKERPYVVGVVEIDREQVALFGRLWSAATAVRGPKPEVLDNCLYMESEELPNDWPSCEKALDGVIREWIKLWDKLGGLPKYLPRKAA